MSKKIGTGVFQPAEEDDVAKGNAVADGVLQAADEAREAIQQVIEPYLRLDEALGAVTGLYHQIGGLESRKRALEQEIRVWEGTLKRVKADYEIMAGTLKEVKEEIMAKAGTR